MKKICNFKYVKSKQNTILMRCTYIYFTKSIEQQASLLIQIAAAAAATLSIPCCQLCYIFESKRSNDGDFVSDSPIRRQLSTVEARYERRGNAKSAYTKSSAQAHEGVMPAQWNLIEHTMNSVVTHWIR